MKYFQLIFTIATFLLTIGCKTSKPKQITKKQDYQAFLNIEENNSLNIATKDLEFWTQKINLTPTQNPYYLKLAAANSTIFKLTGDINQLKIAEENLTLANSKTNFDNSVYLRALARNYISQHRFKEALSLLLKAEKNGEHLTRTQLMLVDVYLELGELDLVRYYLSKLKNFNDFDYLIRLSKFNDHIGNLENAILYLENALVIAESSNNKNLIEWNYTNLADYYGHAGRIEDSYNAYLKALSINPNNSYAKKGISWIVYSYEREPEEALRILAAISKENTAPDYLLLKSEIAGFMGNIVEKENLEKRYLCSVRNKKYGAMYTKYTILLFANDANKKEQAIELAKQELLERPSAQSYDLLAWSYYKNGKIKKALEITMQYVINKTFEPEVLLHTAYILKANGQNPEAKKIQKELLGAIFELGPVSENRIRNI